MCKTRSLELFFLFSIWLTISQTKGNVQLVEYTIESCYGRTIHDFLEPNCSSGEVLYIRDVYTYAKPLDISCPQDVELSNRNETICCRYASSDQDCGMRYYSSADVYLGTHYTECVGKVSCKVRVAWNRTDNTCNQSVFMDKTNYMREYYHCIPSASIASICNSTTIVNNPVYIWNDGYPGTSGNCSSNSGCKCIVTSTNNSPIKIDVFDIRFQKNIDCLQRLHIKDGSSEYVIDCDNTNGFARVSTYTSSTNSIEVRYDDTATTRGGNFWISLEAFLASSSLAVTCSKTTPVYNCSSTLPSILRATSTDSSMSTDSSTTSLITLQSTIPRATSTDSSTTSLMTLQSTTQIQNDINTQVAQNPESLSSDDKMGLTIGLTLAALVVASLLIIGGVIWKKYKSSKNKVIPESEYEEAFGTIESDNVAPINTAQYKDKFIGTYKP